MTNSIMKAFPDAKLLLAASPSQVERALLGVFKERTDDPLRRMTTAQAIAGELFAINGYPYDVKQRSDVDRIINRATKRLENAGLIEEPDFDNGKNGYRVISDEGRKLIDQSSQTGARTRTETTAGLTPYVAHNPIKWDAFVSHASEDKDDFVRPLVQELERRGLRVWYDEFSLTVGDSLRRSIDHGLAASRFGIVVISPSFLRKEWPQRELDGLVAREIGGVKVILPVWHNLAADDVRNYSPTLADRVAISSRKGLQNVIEELVRAIAPSEERKETHFEPDIDARTAFFRVLEKSKWSVEQRTNPPDFKTTRSDWLKIRLSNQIHNYLAQGKLIAWGETNLPHATGPQRKIEREEWEQSEILFDDINPNIPRTLAKSRTNDRVLLHGIAFSKAQVFRVFPLVQNGGAEAWRPIFAAIRYISEKVGDNDSTHCWPRARNALRQAAYDKGIRIRGRKQLQDKPVFREDGYSAIHTDVGNEYWAVTEINALATSPEHQTDYHTDPQSAYAWSKRPG